MPPIAVFDFDGTLYRKDSFIEFTKYVLKKHPLRLRYLPVQCYYLVCHKLSIIETRVFKEKFLCYLNGVDEELLQKWLDAFWETQTEDRFNQALLAKSDDFASQGVAVVCVSASPSLFIAKQLGRLGIPTVIATELKYVDGKYLICTKNCRGQEKISRLHQFFSDSYDIIEAYSDNSDDINLLLQAKKAYRISSNGEIIPVSKQS